MKKCFFALFVTLFAFSCVREQIGSDSVGSVVINATASLDGTVTKMIFQDNYEDSCTIRAGWKTGDTFLALQINGSTVTPVTFTATASAKVKASFVSSGAVAASADTRWVAVLGKGAVFSADGISCSFSGQNGTLTGLERCDYMTASSIGETPDFKFSDGEHLTYLLRIIAPEGVDRIEFNTCDGATEFIVGSDGSIRSCVADYCPDAVKTVNLDKTTTSGQVVYLEVPAIDYSEAGLIITAMNGAGTRSQGKVKSEDFSAKGGKFGVFEFPDLIDRPTAESAIDFVTKSGSTIKYQNNTSYSGINDLYEFTNSPRWAPFNVGAKAQPSSAEDCYGGYFAWGETETRDTYSDESYRYAGIGESIGYLKEYRGDGDMEMFLATVCGTKYDVARVKWGSEWRMPFLEELISLTGSNSSVTFKPGKDNTTETYFHTTDVTTYNGVSVKGRTYSKNGRELFLPFAGRYFYLEGSSISKRTMVGSAGFYFCGTHNASTGSAESYRMYIDETQMDYDSQKSSFGFSVRPVLAETTDREPDPVCVSGYIKDSVTGAGIAGVTVSDGYNCCETDSEGNYEIEANVLSRSINVTVPSGYKIPIDENGCPAFFKRVDLKSCSQAVVNFTLDPLDDTANRFTVVFIADSHVRSEDHLNRLKEGMGAVQNTVNGLSEAGNAGEIIGIALGDQMWDSLTPDLALNVREEYSAIRNNGATVPFFYLIGNHDHQAGFSDTDADYQSTNLFVKYFGPVDYSFDRGGAHIVVMDDIWNTGNDGAGEGGVEQIGYKTKITGEQLHWLKQDIANVKDKENKIIIFCTHAPLYGAIGNCSGIQQLLVQFGEAHVMSGHIHNLTNDTYSGVKSVTTGRAVIEHNVQSLCGMWWLGDLSPNGTPAGYGVYTFDNGTLAEEYSKVTKEDSGFQMRVYSGNDTYDGYTAGSGVVTPKKNNTYEWGSEYAGKFLVRVWDGEDPTPTTWEDSWEVSFIQGDVSRKMVRIEDGIVDKCAASYIVNILGSPYGTGDSSKSQTWWMIDAPGGDPAAEIGWRIQAKHVLRNGWSRTYTCSALSRDYSGYPCGSRYKITY